MEINSNTAYMIGLFQSDGSLSKESRNRGRLSYEISSRDEDIIYKLEKMIPYNSPIVKRFRESSINGYKYYTESIRLRVYNLEFRTFLNENGVPYGKKSKSVKPPLHLPIEYVRDYLRGLYDGDGSMGMTGKDYPFISFTTDSDDMANFIATYISKTTVKPRKTLNRNKRDNVYNICIFREDAVKLCEDLYYNDCLSINRKYNKASEVKNWVRPATMKVAPPRLKWTKDDDNFILEHDVDESIEVLGRTEKSIKTRLWRISKGA